jgi:hypothetical protein
MLKLVDGLGFEPRSIANRATALPLCYPSMVGGAGVEPASCGHLPLNQV